MGEANEELNVEGPGGFKVKARGTDIIAVIVLVTGIVGVVLLYMHMQDAKADAVLIATAQKESTMNLAAALRDIAATNRELVSATKVTNCMIELEPTARQGSLQRCERIVR